VEMANSVFMEAGLDGENHLEQSVCIYFSDGRTLSGPFMKLPSKQELPDYYNIIKKPIDIKKIQQRLEESKVNFEIEHAVGAVGHVDCLLCKSYLVLIMETHFLYNEQSEHSQNYLMKSVCFERRGGGSGNNFLKQMCLLQAS
jgi:Transcription factor involved in chromatin remodeling, contains bromodomain